jgi:site-specific DNA recombinase
LPTAYDDGGISGGTLKRPGIQQLLADIQNRRVDIVVVYKVDRLTRSLADFARMVELFDAHGVSFVSVTQQFNTTNSMGRLTLNVLLSFAQFEREVTGERIRDKIAASKKKGMWMGGNPPLGYEVHDRKLIIKPDDAAKARTIFTRYLELNSVRELYTDLIDRGIRSAKGHIISRGALYKMLSNPLYIGQVRHKGVCYPGQHEALITLDVWQRVQQRIADHRIGLKTQSSKTQHGILDGKLYDVAGERLVTFYARKK